MYQRSTVIEEALVTQGTKEESLKVLRAPASLGSSPAGDAREGRPVVTVKARVVIPAECALPLKGAVTFQCRDCRPGFKSQRLRRNGTSAVYLEIENANQCAKQELELESRRFLYSDEVQIGPETVMTTLYTAKKYAVPALEAHCVDFLTKHLRADNAFMLLTQARLFDEPQLASLCLDTIDKSTVDAISAEGFTDIDIDTLCAVLERDTLSIRESRLFGAIVRWAEAECQRQQLPVTFGNKQKVLGKALSLIRFPLMTIEEFAAGPAQSGILSDREVVNLFLHFTVNPKPRVEYIDRPRCCLRGKECCINRFQQVESRWGYSGTSDRIRFTVNRRISVVGFGLYGSIHGPTDYQVNIQIIEYEKKQTLGQNDTGFSCDGTANTFRVMFKEPIEILPNVCYTACATLKGPDSHYGTKGLKKVVHETPAASKTVFQFFSSPGNNNGTSIEDGQIPEIIFYT
nr:BTB/POZ domain-containing protein 1 [Peromyscus maniculatus bairdii]